MDRIKEPSTWAGFGQILMPLAAILPGVAGWIVGGAGALCGGMAVWLRERPANA